MSSYKNHSVMKEVLQYLDETLLPPELLAVPDRKKDGAKVSGASNRLYDQDSIRKKHNLHLELKRNEALRAATTQLNYDSHQDAHLKKFWGKKKNHERRQCNEVTKPTSQQRASSNSVGGGHGGTRRGSEAHQGTIASYRAASPLPLTSSLSSSSNGISRTDPVKKLQSESTVHSPVVDQHSAISSTRASSISSTSSSSSSSSSSSAATLNTISSSPISHKEVKESMIVQANKNQKDESDDRSYWSSSSSSSSSSDHNDERNEDGDKDNEEHDKNAYQDDFEDFEADGEGTGNKKETETRKNEVEKDDEEAKAANPATIDANIVVFDGTSDAKVPENHQQQQYSCASSPPASSTQPKTEITPATETATESCLNYIKLGKNDKGVDLPFKSLTEALRSCESAANNNNNNNNNNSNDENAPPSTLEGISNATLPSIPVRVNHRVESLRRNIRRTAAAYSQLEVVRSLTSMTPEPRVGAGSKKGTLQHFHNSSARSEATKFTVSPQMNQMHRQQEQQQQQQDEAIRARHLLPSSINSPTSDDQQQHNEQQQQRSSLDVTTMSTSSPGSFKKSKKRDDSVTMRRHHISANNLLKQKQNKDPIKKLLQSLEPHISGDEILVLCEFLLHHRNSNAPVSAMSKSLSLNWITKKNSSSSSIAGQEQEQQQPQSATTNESGGKKETKNCFHHHNGVIVDGDDVDDDDDDSKDDDSRKQEHQDPDFEHQPHPSVKNQRPPSTTSSTRQTSNNNTNRRTVVDLQKSVRTGVLFNDKNFTDRHRVSSPRSAIAMVRHGVTIEVLTMSGVSGNDSILRSSPFQKRVVDHAESSKRYAAGELIDACVGEYDKILKSGVTREHLANIIREVAIRSFGGLTTMTTSTTTATKRNRSNASYDDDDDDDDGPRGDGRGRGGGGSADSVGVCCPLPRPVSAPVVVTFSPPRGNALVEFSPSFQKHQKIMDGAFKASCRSVIHQFDLLLQHEEKDKALQDRLDQLAAGKLAKIKQIREKTEARLHRAMEIKTRVEEVRRKEVTKNIVEGIESSKMVMRFHEARRLAMKERRAIDEAERTCVRRTKQNNDEVSRAVKAAVKDAVRNRVSNRIARAAEEFAGESIQRRRQEQVASHQRRQIQNESLQAIKRQLAVAVIDASEYARKHHER